MIRRKELVVNSVTGLFSQIINILCGLVLPAAILRTYGSSANGLTNSISNFLGFIGLCELGMGTVVQSSLYKPLAEKDYRKISCIMKSSRRFFGIIGAILFAYVIGLCIFYPTLITEFDRPYVIMMILALSINSFTNYYFGICNALLLHADQKSYIPLGLQAIFQIVSTAASLALIRMNTSLLTVKYVAAAIFLVRPLLMSLYVRKNYNLIRDITYTTEPIQQKWNGIAQHVASVIVDRTDIVVLTVFSTLQNVSTYSVYSMVVSNIRGMIEASMSGIQAVMGDLFFREETEALQAFFGRIEWIVHNVVVFLYCVTGILIVPFIMIYTRGVEDANYNVPMFAVLIVAAYGGFSLQAIYKLIVKAAGHYRQTQMASVVEAVINVAVSIVLVRDYGLPGVAIGTILAMLFRLLYHVWYIKHYILFRGYGHFFKQIGVDAITVTLILMLAKYVAINFTNYLLWVVSAVKVSIIAAAVIALVNCVFYKEYFTDVVRQIAKVWKRQA